MIDLTVPEAIRTRTPDFSVTSELRCPVCGCRPNYRSYDEEHETFVFHCISCGHDSALTWAAVAVLRAKGEVKFEDGEPIIPEDVEIPPFPDDPNNAAYEVFEIMQEAKPASESGEEGGDNPVVPTKDYYDVIVTGYHCLISSEKVDTDFGVVRPGQNYVQYIFPEEGKEIPVDENYDADLTKIIIKVNGTQLNPQTWPSNIEVTAVPSNIEVTAIKLVVKNVNEDFRIDVTVEYPDSSEEPVTPTPKPVYYDIGVSGSNCILEDNVDYLNDAVREGQDFVTVITAIDGKTIPVNADFEPDVSKVSITLNGNKLMADTWPSNVEVNVLKENELQLIIKNVTENYEVEVSIEYPDNGGTPIEDPGDEIIDDIDDVDDNF